MKDYWVSLYWYLFNINNENILVAKYNVLEFEIPKSNQNPYMEEEQTTQ